MSDTKQVLESTGGQTVIEDCFQFTEGQQAGHIPPLHAFTPGSCAWNWQYDHLMVGKYKRHFHVQ